MSLLHRKLRIPWPQIRKTISSSSQYGIKKSTLSASQIRSRFIKYFTDDYHHVYVPSSPVTLANDPSVTFVSAGMNQFKPIFLGQIQPGSPMSSYRRAVNSQKCIRAGGKHNDLDDVGYDGSHHTFFEMLGNWSFSDYFKKDACKMAWDLLTQHFKLPKDQLYVTYFAGDTKNGLEPDLECRDVWLSLGLPDERILPFASKDNFWDMGKTGPCGPCTEIHFDHVGSRYSPQLVNTGDPQVVEVWNLVFIQYNRLNDGKLEKLPKQHVDTGMGLERLTAILQGSQSNYDTDLFRPLFSLIHEQSSVRPYRGLMGAADNDGIDCAYRIIADHARMSTISISDGVLPDEYDAGHCLRRIIRRAAAAAKTKLGVPAGLLSQLVDPVVDSLGIAYPTLNLNVPMVKNVINEEENRFLNQFYSNEERFEEIISNLKSNIFPGEEMFKLCGLGFPEEILLKSIQSRGLIADIKSFNAIKLSVKEKDESVRASILLEKEIEGKKYLNDTNLISLQKRGIAITDDSLKYSYPNNKNLSSKVLTIFINGEFTDEISENESGCLIIDQTNFYSEAGGQSGDKGLILNENFVFQVEDVQLYRGYVQHYGKVTRGRLKLNDKVKIEIDEQRRNACARSHTATHLLTDALNVLIPNSKPRSFNSEPDYLSLSITTKNKLTKKQIEEVEHLVNKVIMENKLVEVRIINKTEIEKQIPTLTIEETNYPDPLRIISIETQSLRSVEACCGTHVTNSGDVGKVVVVGQKPISQTVRRIKAVSGNLAAEVIKRDEKLKNQLHNLKNEIRAHPQSTSDEITAEVTNRVQRGIRDIRNELKNNITSYLVRLKLENGTEELKRKIAFLLQKRENNVETEERLNFK